MHADNFSWKQENLMEPFTHSFLPRSAQYVPSHHEASDSSKEEDPYPRKSYSWFLWNKDTLETPKPT